MVDKLDTEIARYLIDNSKLSIRDLAKLCNVSPGTTKENGLSYSAIPEILLQYVPLSSFHLHREMMNSLN